MDTFMYTDPETGETQTITRGSGNVYADLGVRDAEAMHRKAQIAGGIIDAIEAQGLTQKTAARKTGATQPEISNITRGKFRGISESRLIEILAALGNDVSIRSRPTPSGEAGVITAEIAPARPIALGDD